MWTSQFLRSMVLLLSGAVVHGAFAAPSPRTLTPWTEAPTTILSDETLTNVREVMEQLCTHSWENGTKAQALLEYAYPNFSPFSPDFEDLLKNKHDGKNIPEDILTIARTTLENRPVPPADVGFGPLLQDEAAGDPASLGIPVLLAGLSETDGSDKIKGVGWGEAADSQFKFLLEKVGRNPFGAISHRVEYTQAWADFVAMVPPFLAYYGYLNGSQAPLQEAHRQCSAYRNTLQNNITKLWRHMEISDKNPDWPDLSLWATGNAWAASGMLRVFATILRSPFSGGMSLELQDLKLWTLEIIAGVSLPVYLSDEGLVHNRVTNSSSFTDTAASALLAATMYRLAVLNVTSAYVPTANHIYSTIAEKYINGTGYLTGAVDPMKFDVQGTYSPEGQAFVLMMHGAYSSYNETAAARRRDNDIDDGGAAQGETSESEN